MDSEQKIIKLKTEDGKTVEMSKKAADRSEVLKKNDFGLSRRIRIGCKCKL